MSSSQQPATDEEEEAVTAADESNQQKQQGNLYHNTLQYEAAGGVGGGGEGMGGAYYPNPPYPRYPLHPHIQTQPLLPQQIQPQEYPSPPQAHPVPLQLVGPYIVNYPPGAVLGGQPMFGVYPHHLLPHQYQNIPQQQQQFLPLFQQQSHQSYQYIPPADQHQYQMVMDPTVSSFIPQIIENHHHHQDSNSNSISYYSSSSSQPPQTYGHEFISHGHPIPHIFHPSSYPQNYRNISSSSSFSSLTSSNTTANPGEGASRRSSGNDSHSRHIHNTNPHNRHHHHHQSSPLSSASSSFNNHELQQHHHYASSPASSPSHSSSITSPASVPRPDGGGTLGKAVQLFVNFFKVSVPDRDILRYGE